MPFLSLLGAVQAFGSCIGRATSGALPAPQLDSPSGAVCWPDQRVALTSPWALLGQSHANVALHKLAVS